MSSIWLVKWRLQRVICVREGASYFRSEMFDQDYWYVTLGCHYESDMLSAKPTNFFNQGGICLPGSEKLQICVYKVIDLHKWI